MPAARTKTVKKAKPLGSLTAKKTAKTKTKGITSLKTYWAKRDFAKTPEPSGIKERRQAKRGSYLIQKHDARRLHYDFRLEHDGVLLSWAVTKGPSLDPAIKRLAVRTEDHPLSYGTFEGTIPKGQYGGGTVMLWDRGTWAPLKDVDEGLQSGRLEFELYGERLKGQFALIRMRPRSVKDTKRENWLLIKMRDAYAKDDDNDELLEDEITSITTGRSMDVIAVGQKPFKKTQKTTQKTTQKKSKPKSLAFEAKPKQVKAKPFAFIAPQLCTLVDAPPEGDDWLHEIKFDGYRTSAYLDQGTALIRTRKGLDWTARFAHVAREIEKLDVKSLILDGEMAVRDARGHTDFGALQNALSGEGVSASAITYHVFDLLMLNGKDLRQRPLSERKEKLKEILKGAKPLLVYSDHVMGGGSEIFANACKLGLEGIVSKKADSKYVSARTLSWLKSKCGMGQEFVIIGWTKSGKKGRPFSNILLGLREKGRLRYKGRVGSGFNDRTLTELAGLFASRAQDKAPVDDVPRMIARTSHFIKPDLVAEFAFRGWTREGYVRQGSFKGLRSDKPASAIKRDFEKPVSVIAGKRTAKETSMIKTSLKESTNIEGVRVTHPDRVMYEGVGVTKQDLIDYYLKIADLILPHVKERPLSLVRCPEGRAKSCFFQKHASPGFPETFGAIPIKEKSGKRDYLFIKNRKGLVGAVQMGALELHVWGAPNRHVEIPERIVFDLDPAEGLSFEALKPAARELKERLEAIGLKSFLLASGGKGLHVVVPLSGKQGWDDVKNFAHAMARAMSADNPKLYLAVASKAKREGRIFIDYLRNGRGATAIAPYSSRAREGAPVALPISWTALSKLKNAHPMSVTDGAKIAKRADPWTSYFEIRQNLPLKRLRGL